MNQIISKEEAKQQGLKQFFTGLPCKYGHVSERFVSTRQCRECQNSHSKGWRKVNPEKMKSARKGWAANNPDRNKELQQRARLSPKGKASQAKRSRKHYLDKKEDCDKRTKAWSKAHPEYQCAAQGKRRASKLQQTPSWANLEAILEVYKECRQLKQATGKVYHVDHIVPLQGKYVSGLHVEYNLQILTGSENISKGNKLTC